MASPGVSLTVLPLKTTAARPVSMFRWGQAALVTTAVGLLVGCQAVAMWAQGGSVVDTGKWPSFTAPTASAGQLLLRVLCLGGVLRPGPGPVDAVRATAFPWLPVVAVAMLGAAAGSTLARDADRGYAKVAVVGAGLLVAWGLVRAVGGAALNLRGPPRGEGRDSAACWLFCMAKGPPDFASTLFYAGVGGLLVYGFHRLEPHWAKYGEGREQRDEGKGRVLKGLRWAGDEVLDTFYEYGSAPLIFYWAHQLFISGVALYLPETHGAPAYVVQPFVFAYTALGMRYVCRGYSSFKKSQPEDSCWHMF